MSKRNPKRVAVDSHQFQSTNEDDKFRLKHQELLQDYLELQKDFVSKKKKLQIVEQKKGILLAEIEFLRQRHIYLVKTQSDNLIKIEEDLVPTRNSPEPIKMEKMLKNCLINGKKLARKKISWEDQMASKI